jgi:hypothetical protein
MKVKRRYILQRIDGALMTIRLEIAKDIDTAARFHTEEDVQNFLFGHHGPSDPENYRAVPMKITYELESVEHANTESGTKESETAVGYQRA